MTLKVKVIVGFPAHEAVAADCQRCRRYVVYKVGWAKWFQCFFSRTKRGYYLPDFASIRRICTTNHLK